MSKEFLVGVYKEVGKNPDIIKIKNQKDYLERLVNGEYTTLDYDDYVIIYKKKSDNLLANVYVDRYSKMGISIKGKLFIVGKDKNGNFISLNKDQFLRCTKFLVKESFNYKNFDEYGRYIPKSKRNSKKLFDNKNNLNKIMPNLSENKKSEFNKQITNETINGNKISDEQTLKMILKILFTLLEFVKDTLEDSSDEQI